MLSIKPNITDNEINYYTNRIKRTNKQTTKAKKQIQTEERKLFSSKNILLLLVLLLTIYKYLGLILD